MTTSITLTTSFWLFPFLMSPTRVVLVSWFFFLVGDTTYKQKIMMILNDTCTCTRGSSLEHPLHDVVMVMIMMKPVTKQKSRSTSFLVSLSCCRHHHTLLSSSSLVSVECCQNIPAKMMNGVFSLCRKLIAKCGKLKWDETLKWMLRRSQETYTHIHTESTT